MEEPKFSITIPAYKENYLSSCIDSILNQTYPNFELIIVNDNSPYDIDGVVSAYEDDRIHYYKNEKNIGSVDLVLNWNKALEYCSGDYVICMGDDDRLLPDCLELYRKLIHKYPACRVYHMQSQIIDQKDTIISVQSARPEYETVYSFIWHELMDYRKQYIGDFLFDLAHLRENGGFYYLPCAWHSDRISVMIAAKESGIANCAEYGFQYRKHQGTISSMNYAVEKCDAWLAAGAWYDEFLKTEPSSEIDRIFYREICSLWPNYQKNKIWDTIVADMAERLGRVFFWQTQRKKYNYSMKRLFMLFCHALKKRQFRKRR